MGETQDLRDEEAVAKIRDIAGSETGMLCTFPLASWMRTRPMMTQGVDPDGTLWYFSGKGSEKNREIRENAVVQVIYSFPSKSAYLCINGTARVSRDQSKINDLWTGWAKAWFPQGKDDPELTLISVKPTGGYYWDTKTNRMVQLAKIAYGALMGQTTDDGVMGELSP